MERKKVLNLAIDTLYSQEGKEALDYLKTSRGFSAYTINSFGLGYVPSRVNNIYGDPHEFAGRIVLPIRNSYGDLVALSSRDFREGARNKFFHEQFKKSNCLFALDIAKASIIKNNKVIVVEGELDVMKMYSVGIKYTVGTWGSSFSIKQVSLLARYCQEIFLLFDGDDAGRNVIRRSMKMNITYGLDGSGITLIPSYLPDGFDPDDFIKENGKDEMIKLLRRSKKSIGDQS